MCDTAAPAERDQSLRQQLVYLLRRETFKFDFWCLMIQADILYHDLRRLRTFASRSAAVGAIVWLLLILTVTTDSHETELIHKVVFFALLVLVPLGLSLVTGRRQEGSIGLFRVAVMAQPLAAIATIASFFLEKGLPSAALSATWLLFTAIVGLFGLTRLLRRGLYPLAESSVDAGLLYLPVAGGWLVIYRYGIQPFDYGETIILLTVVHFHFAGFAAPIIAGMAGRLLTKSQASAGRLFPFVVFALIAALPLVAAGITFSPWLGLAGTLLLTTGLMMLAVITIGKVLPRVRALGPRLLLLFGSLCSCVAMVLACLYAYSIVTHTLILRIPTMAMSHGLLNAFGFAACSLFAWSRITVSDLRD